MSLPTRTLSVDLAALEKRALTIPANVRKMSAKEQAALLASRADTVVTQSELEARLTESKTKKRPLEVKLGVDATGPVLHLGHVVTLLTARLLQDMGHHFTLVVGDFTATIGDPSGRVKERPILTEREVASNVRTYKKQAGLFVDLKKADIKLNSKWLNKLSLGELFGYLRLQTVAQAMEREDFRARPSVTRAEMLYASLQGIDSVELETDLEIGGRDQLLNFIEARELMRRLDLRPQSILTMPLLPGTDGTGKKMSKSAGNFISVLDSATDVYGKTMAVADKDVLTYFKLLTFLSPSDLKDLERAQATDGEQRKHIKMLLARVLTRLVHGSDKAVQKAEEAFTQTFSNREAPQDATSVRIVRADIKDLADLLVRIKAAPSRSEAKRLVQGNAVALVDGAKRSTVQELSLLKENDVTLHIGKRTFVRIQFS